MGWPWVWFALALGSIGATISGFAARGDSSDSSASASFEPALHIPASILTLGEIWDRSSIDLMLPVTNRSLDFLNCSFSASCNCSSVSPPRLALHPGETRLLTATIRLPVGSMRNEFPFGLKLVAHFKGIMGQNANAWSLEGVSRSHLILAPRSLEFDDLRVDGTSVARTITVGCSVPLQKIDCSGGAGLLDISVSADQEPSSFLIQVRANPDVMSQARKLELKLKLVARTTDGRELPSAEVPVRIAVGHDVEMFPSVAFVGAHTIGSPVTQDFEIASHRERPFSVEAINTSSDLVSIEPKTDVGYKKSYVLIVRADKLGTNRSEVKFLIRDSVEKDPYLVVVPVLVVGTDSASLTAEPASAVSDKRN